MEIVIRDLIKVSSNKIYAGMHWTARKRLKDNYLMITSPFKRMCPIDEKVDLDFKFYFTKNVLDSSNCSFLAKMLEDCLVHHGVLKDDSIKYVGRVSIQSFKSEEKESDYCVININLEI